jgi:uncharacterized tellurite resistance protein B-like protein
MKNAIKRFFERYLAPEEGGESAAQHRLRLATAALLVGLSRVDDRVTDEERRAVMQAVQSKFSLSAEESQSLIELAEDAASNATSDYEFTSLLNRNLTPEQKVRLVEHLWEVAFADRTLDKYEEHFVRRIADLLYVSHTDFIAAKLRAERAAVLE